MLKKRVAHQFNKDFNIDISVIGVRREEGGVRKMAYNSCFSEGKKGSPAQYRPLFWWTDSDKKQYCDFYKVEHSRCYTEYGLKRTGCCGCPYGQELDEELKILEKYEPNLYKAVCSVFKESYEYKKAYYKFRTELKTKNKHQTQLMEEYD